MILAIDVGNTNIVIGCCEGERITFVERISTAPDNTVLEYAISFKTVLELYGISPSDIGGAIISSVVPSVTYTIKAAIKKIVGVEAKVIGPGIKTGVNIVIDNPAQLGSDLVVDAAAGIAEYPLPLIIFDMGTATTASVIDENGSYLGGMIIPGVSVSLNALTAGTSQLPKISLESPKKIIGRNTADCMKSGILFGTAASLDGIIDRIEDELGKKTTVVATGGLAGIIIPHCKHKIILDDELLLKGLIIIYNKNI
ncbi:MAG: type III pantothenate kinase [Oscillospiraceae bacterium]|nr:type III pantothenate kinase [Oscillospiraceae bacterium]